MREVIRFERDGRLWVADDITDEEKLRVFPALVQFALERHRAFLSLLASPHFAGEWPDSPQKEFKVGG